MTGNKKRETQRRAAVYGRGKDNNMAWKQSCERKRRLEKTFAKTSRSYFGVYYDEDKNRFVRLYRQNGRSRYCRRLANRAVRRYRGELPRNGAYRKVYDYWWMLI